MTLALYGHPFASFVWKPLIALYERDVAFTFRMVDSDHLENQERINKLSPTGRGCVKTASSPKLNQRIQAR